MERVWGQCVGWQPNKRNVRPAWPVLALHHSHRQLLPGRGLCQLHGERLDFGQGHRLWVPSWLLTTLTSLFVSGETQRWTSLDCLSLTNISRTFWGDFPILSVHQVSWSLPVLGVTMVTAATFVVTFRDIFNGIFPYFWRRLVGNPKVTSRRPVCLCGGRNGYDNTVTVWTENMHVNLTNLDPEVIPKPFSLLLSRGKSRKLPFQKKMQKKQMDLKKRLPGPVSAHWHRNATSAPFPAAGWRLEVTWWCSGFSLSPYCKKVMGSIPGPGAFLCDVCMSLCLWRLSLGSPVSFSSPKTFSLLPVATKSSKAFDWGRPGCVYLQLSCECRL